MNSKRFLVPVALAAILAGCQTAPSSPDPTGRANADMLRVLTAYQASGAKPVATLSVEQARAQPTPGDAATAVAVQRGLPAKMPLAQVTDIQIQGAAGPIPARVYDPQTGRGGAPVILYFHGGGWVTGTLDTYDASDRALANGTGAIVVSVQYRLGPENRFPAAQNDADAAYVWLLRNAGTIGADPQRIALAGESAGGNLAIDTAIWARDGRLPPPVHQLLVYPVVGTDLTTPSYKETTDAIPLNRRAITWYVGHFTNGPADLKDPRLNLVGAADLHGLPPTTIISAEIDPLRSEGEALAGELAAAGVPVEQRTYTGVTHEFFGMGAVVGEAKRAEDFAAMRLKAAFAPPALTPTPRQPGRRARLD
jgi:acetyl esterase/lipase